MIGDVLHPTGLATEENSKWPREGLASGSAVCVEGKTLDWFDLIEQVFSHQFHVDKTIDLNKKLDITIQEIKTLTGTLSNNVKVQSFPDFIILANHLTSLYRLMSYYPIAQEERLFLAQKQQKLLLAAMAVERERFHLTCWDGKEPQGANRSFSQVSFFEYLSSVEGVAVIKEMSSNMSSNESALFNRTLDFLNNGLSEDYLKILSVIEAAKHVIENSKQSDHTDFLKGFENNLAHLLSEMLQEKDHLLIPLGWSLPKGQLGHHLFLLVERLSDGSDANFRFVDTALTSQESLEQAARVDNIGKLVLSAALSDKKSMESFQAAEPLSSRKCSTGYHINNLSEKIKRIARILMLQIPHFTNDYCARLQNKNAPLNSKKIQDILYNINYALVDRDTTTKIDEHQTSPLSMWNQFPSPACAFSSFQPLIQMLALKVSNDMNIQLSEREEINLQHYFEILLQSYKLFLIKNFSIHAYSKSQNLHDLFTKAVHQTINESGNAIALDG